MKQLDELKVLENCVEVQLPNEIFEDLSRGGAKSYGHKCLAYSYYYLCNYLYRNAIYGVVDASDYSLMSLSSIFTSKYSNVSYITKEGGMLDALGYTETTRNYPISYTYMEDVLDFVLREDLKDVDMASHSPRLSIKIPLKSFVRFDNEDFTGTYYDFQSTHLIRLHTFIDIIRNKKLGHVGLFIYGYLKMMNDRFKDGYAITYNDLSEVVGCNVQTIPKYIAELEGKGFIKSRRNLVENRNYEKIYTVS